MPLIETHDQYGNLTSRRTEDWSTGKITNVVFQDIASIALITETPVDPVASLWERVASRPPPTPWIVESPPAIQRFVGAQTTAIQTAPAEGINECDLLGLVPGVGLFLEYSCEIMKSVGFVDSITSFFNRFAAVEKYAMYVRGVLFSVIGRDAVDEVMSTASRGIRNQIRFRKGGM